MPSDSYNTPSGLIGTSGRITYDYDTRYMAEINVAYNGTENFAKENRFDGFPPFHLAGCQPMNHSSLQTIGLLLKIRGSYGVVGNDRIGGRRYLYLPGTYNIIKVQEVLQADHQARSAATIINSVQVPVPQIQYTEVHLRELWEIRM